MAYNLLTINQAKISKGEKLGYLTGILHLLPSYNKSLCPYASTYCRKDCLVYSGRAEFVPNVLKGRERKSKLFFEHRDDFIKLLVADIEALRRKAKREGMKLAIRLNGTSDILWERLIDMSQFPDVQFYDYTKIPLHLRKGRTANYHLTFSYSGNNLNEVKTALKQGENVAIVFNVTQPKIRNSSTHGLPDSFLGYKVVNGIDHDLRFLEASQNVVIGLIPKGKRAIASAKKGSRFYV